ncbi:hypothetical protein [Pontibacter sp. G13]|uniref:hypothetical protein n=1 Tax=Pontibacter sp. G13 TaxID=3074898 RepID=UPI00288A33A1|nr:hypothetical protein [Pontibacter sp. G13]WNJ20344.1 hypothetical protein RJD25_07675 [Pontibacter sp. G13]
MMNLFRQYLMMGFLCFTFSAVSVAQSSSLFDEYPAPVSDYFQQIAQRACSCVSEEMPSLTIETLTLLEFILAADDYEVDSLVDGLSFEQQLEFLNFFLILKSYEDGGLENCLQTANEEMKDHPAILEVINLEEEVIVAMLNEKLKEAEGCEVAFRLMNFSMIE